METVKTGHEFVENGVTYRVRVVLDSEGGGDSPREFDEIAVMVLNHGRYDLPFEGELSDDIDRGLKNYGFKTVARWLKVFHGATVVLPVYGYDHGDLTLRAGTAFSDSWDSGLAGVVYDRPENHWEGIDVDKVLRQEVDTYDLWARGEVYGYVRERKLSKPVTDASGYELQDAPEWEHVDSCYGFYSIAEAIEEGEL